MSNSEISQSPSVVRKFPHRETVCGSPQVHCDLPEIKGRRQGPGGDGLIGQPLCTNNVLAFCIEHCQGHLLAEFQILQDPRKQSLPELRQINLHPEQPGRINATRIRQGTIRQQIRFVISGVRHIVKLWPVILPFEHHFVELAVQELQKILLAEAFFVLLCQQTELRLIARWLSDLWGREQPCRYGWESDLKKTSTATYSRIATLQQVLMQVEKRLNGLLITSQVFEANGNLILRQEPQRHFVRVAYLGIMGQHIVKSRQRRGPVAFFHEYPANIACRCTTELRIGDL